MSVVVSAETSSSSRQDTFVGRSRELGQLRAAFDDAVAGHGSLVLLAGEQGIGKTAVCMRLAKYVAEAGRVLWGHCREVGWPSLPYQPFVEAFESYAMSIDNGQLEADLNIYSSEIARLVPAVGARIAIEPPATGDPAQERWRMLQASATFLKNAANNQPLLLILEDLHEADHGTLDLLMHLSQRLDESRVLVLGTYRDTDVDRTHPLSQALVELRRTRSFVRIPMRGLAVEEVRQMCHLMRWDPVSGPEAEAVHDQTEGNPLFVVELLRYVAETAATARATAHYVPDELARVRTDLPESLRDVVGKRLSRLDNQTNELLAIAAVIGSDFELDLLAIVANRSEQEVVSALETAYQHAIVEPTPGVARTTAFRFKHAFFRQMLYDEIFPPRRSFWHGEVARALEARYSTSLEEHAGELATHLAQSSRPEDLVKALEFSQVAAQQAMRVFAHAQAARHLERALELQRLAQPRDHIARCDLLLALGEAMLLLEEPSRVVDSVASEAFDIAETADDARRATRAAIQALEALSRPWHQVAADRVTDIHKWVARADRYAEPETVERVYADVWLGLHAVVSGRPWYVTAPLRRAVELARRLKDDAVYGSAAGWALNHLLAIKEFDYVARLAAEFHARPHHRMRAADVVHGLWEVGRVYLGLGQRDVAERAWGELAGLARQSRDPSSELLSLAIDRIIALLEGRLEDAATPVSKRGGLAGGIDARGVPWFNSVVQARALSYLGRTPQVTLDDPGMVMRGGWARRAYLSALLGDCDDARLLLKRFEGITSNNDETAAPFLTLLLEVSLRCGDRRTTEALLRRLSVLTDCIDAWSMISYGRLLGDTCVSLGNPGKARGFYESALDVCRRLAFRPELALVRLELAEVTLSVDPSNRAAALNELELAIGELEAMHMGPALQRAMALRTKTATPSSANGTTDDPFSGTPLTAREREVAALLARGLSNREIAEALVISLSTVEVHVKHVLSKLGFTSRAQVAANAAQSMRVVTAEG